MGLDPAGPRLPRVLRSLVAVSAAVAIAVLPVEARAGPGAESVTLIDTDFAGAGEAVRDLPTDERVEGKLAPGWADDSGWAKVWVRYRPMAEAGEGFLRIEVTRQESGRAQLRHDLPALGDGPYLRLSLTARGPQGRSIVVGVRRRGAPYGFAWQKRLPLDPVWQDYAFTFQPTPVEGPIGLWIVQEGVGHLDLARVRLGRMTRDGLMADLKRRAPAEPLPNLLRNSRMPLGLQSGWMLRRDDSDGDEVRIGADPAVIGPSGSPALRIASEEETLLNAAPFAVRRPWETHTASLYVRGRATGRLHVLGGDRSGATDFAVSGDAWERVAVALEPRPLMRFGAFRIEAAGDLWIDALQVAPGDGPRPYATRAVCEVALATVEPEREKARAARLRVHFDDEPALVRYAVTGKAPEAVLRGKVVTPYGTEAALPDRRLGEEFLTEGTWRYDCLPRTPYGVFRIEAWVEDGSGETLSPPNEVVVLRLRRPRHWDRDAPASPFGTHTLSTTRHILMAKAVGINWTRLHDAGTRYIGWYHLEPEPGQWQFRDAELHRYRRHRMKVLGLLTTAPTWASHFEQPHNSYFDRYYQPKRMGDFARYCRTVARRYRGVIDTWDVWNEPWVHAWWAVGYDEAKQTARKYVTSEHPQADFARLMATAYEAVKEVDPDATVLGVNTTTHGPASHVVSGREWTRGVVAAGGLEHCDVVAYHAYTGARHPADEMARGFHWATDPIVEEAGSLTKPVWMTEGSPTPRMLNEGFYHHTVPEADTDDAFETGDRLSRYLVGLLAQGVEKIFLYSMHCHAYFGSREFAALVMPDGYLHPCAAAHSTTAWLLENTRFVRQVPCDQGVTAYLFQGDGRAVAVVSPMPGHAPWRVPEAQGTEAIDLFGNPVASGEPLGPYLVYLSARGDAAALEQVLRK